MKRFVRPALLCVLLCGFMAAPCGASTYLAAEASEMSDAQKEQIRAIVREVLHEYASMQSVAKPVPGIANGIISDIRLANRNFVRSHGPAYFKPFLDSQHPRATVVTCSDSRVQTHAMDAAPDGDLFMVRDIGNQIATAEGSVEYGVHHLHTPLLLVVGHSACGAIKAAAGDYSHEPATIRRELDSLQTPKGDPGMDSIKLNVNYQVRAAMTKYESDVLSGQLTVVGAIYDFTNEMKQGQGKLNIINVNGETDLAKISALALMQEAPSRKPSTRHRLARKKAKAAAANAPEGTDEQESSKRKR